MRIAYPAQTDESEGVLPSSVADLEIPGLDGTGVTVALLDTGVDPSHPYLRRSVLSGVDVINPGSGGIAQPHRYLYPPVALKLGFYHCWRRW